MLEEKPLNFHCVKSVQIRSFFWSVFSRTRTEYGSEKTLYLDTFHADFICASYSCPQKPNMKLEGGFLPNLFDLQRIERNKE